MTLGWRHLRYAGDQTRRSWEAVQKYFQTRSGMRSSPLGNRAATNSITFNGKPVRNTSLQSLSVVSRTLVSSEPIHVDLQRVHARRHPSGRHHFADYWNRQALHPRFSAYSLPPAPRKCVLVHAQAGRPSSLGFDDSHVLFHGDFECRQKPPAWCNPSKGLQYCPDTKGDGVARVVSFIVDSLILFGKIFPTACFQRRMRAVSPLLGYEAGTDDHAANQSPLELAAKRAFFAARPRTGYKRHLRSLPDHHCPVRRTTLHHCRQRQPVGLSCRSDYIE